MRWYRSLFFKVFLWFWAVMFLAMWAAVLTNDWIEDDYFRPASEREVMHLVHMMEQDRPILAEGRKLWRKVRPGWNLVFVPADLITQLPHDLEEFADQAALSGNILFGQNDGWLMIGPLEQSGYLYIGVARRQWPGLLENEDRWLVPVAMVLVVTLLCFVLVWSLTIPIRRLQRTVRRLAAGNFDVSDLRHVRFREDEIGLLAGEVMDMAGSLQRLLHSHQQLLRDVSHELRSPLTRLQIALGIARKKDQQSLLQSEHDRIERAVQQVDGLVSQILDLARLQQSDRQLLQQETLGVQEQLREWVDDADMELQQKQLQIDWNIPAGELLCHWDWLLVQRAFDNLLRNAIRFAPHNSVIQVGLTLSHGLISLWVQDQGPGVPEEQLESIFDPFTQVDSARDHAAGGYGLGLALVRRIVELHDGIVSAGNASPGLRVTMRLPQKNGPDKT